MDNPVWVYISNITFIRGFFNDLVLSGVAQGWTLTIEECFYAMAPVIFILSTKWKLRYQVLAIYISGILLWLIFKNVKFYGFFGSLSFVFYYSFFGRCLDLYLGVAIARLYKRKGGFPVIKKHFTVIGGLLVMATTVLLVIAAGDKDYAIYCPQGIFINNFILPFAIAILFWGLLHERTVFSKLLGSKVFLWLGKSSYTFYLIHMGVFSELIYQYVTGNYLLNFPLLIVLSIFLFSFVEDPLHKWIRGGRHKISGV
jgi:peptidoglycan/LPS O-acetylase OafA/YrhL